MIGGVVFLGLGGALAMTNPDQEAYEQFATNQLMRYAKDELCNNNEGIGSFLAGSCESLIELGRSPARQIIAQQTEQQNFIFFSRYVSDLSVNEFVPAELLDQPLPEYHVESIGIFQNFIIYEIQER